MFWESLGRTEAAVLLLCAAVSALRFGWCLLHEGRLGRQAAALALVAVAAGDAAQALALFAAGNRMGPVLVAAPACAGAVLIALLAVEQSWQQPQ